MTLIRCETSRQQGTRSPPQGEVVACGSLAAIGGSSMPRCVFGSRRRGRMGVCRARSFPLWTGVGSCRKRQFKACPAYPGAGSCTPLRLGKGSSRGCGRRSVDRRRVLGDRWVVPDANRAGPARQRARIALDNMSTPRNQQHERAKKHESHNSVQTSQPRDAMTKREMDG